MGQGADAHVPLKRNKKTYKESLIDIKGNNIIAKLASHEEISKNKSGLIDHKNHKIMIILD